MKVIPIMRPHMRCAHSQKNMFLKSSRVILVFMLRDDEYQVNKSDNAKQPVSDDRPRCPLSLIKSFQGRDDRRGAGVGFREEFWGNTVSGEEGRGSASR